MKSISTVATLFAAATTLSQSNVLARSNGAATCGTGKSIMRGHRGTGGTLASSDLVLMWGGVELDPSKTTTVGIDVDHTFQIISSDNAGFKGFLLRLSGKNGENASTTLVAVDSFAKVNGLCNSDVSGITHRNSNKKSSVEVTLNHPQQAELFLEVTVVTTSSSNWAYDSFDISIAGNSTAPSLPPSSEPEDPPGTSGSAIFRVSSALVLCAYCFVTMALM